MNKRHILFIFIIILLAACSSHTIVTDKVDFVGKGKYWDVKYIYDAKLYDEKHINWVEITYTKEEEYNFDLNDIYIELKSRDGFIKGKLGDMETKIDKNKISFLVGTVNAETYNEDKYELIIKYKEQKDVVKFMQ